MITFITTARHTYTVRALAGNFGVSTPPTRAISYEEMLQSDHVPSGSYVFCDIERLSDLELAMVQKLYRCLAASPDCSVFNNPARVRVRYGLLRQLHEQGINDFDAYAADGCPRPLRFPVFVRRRADHDAAMSALLEDQEQLDARLAELEAEGESLRALVVIEFCAQPVKPGIFRRYGMFRLGTAMHLDHVASEDHWNVKYGKIGLVDDETYADDDRAVRENRFAAELERAFLLAGIDYGRADFGIVDGKPQVYEINTNPFIGTLGSHPSAIRTATILFSHQRFAELLNEMDRAETGVLVPLGSKKLVKYRKEDNAALVDLRRQLTEAQAERESLRKQLRAVMASSSWRVTAPLRSAATLLRKGRGPAK